MRRFICCCFAMLCAAAIWPLAYAVLALLFLAGLAIVPVLARLERTRWRESEIIDGRKILAWRPWWAWIWGNEEDGVRGPTTSTSSSTRRWIERMEGKPEWWRIFSWSALRNPVGNERFSILGTYLRRRRIWWVGNSLHPWLDYLMFHDTSWLFARQGLRCGFWIIVPRGPGVHARLRMGWKIVVGYEREIDRHAGLALQFSLKRKD